MIQKRLLLTFTVQVANTLYFDMPAGTGLSYSTNKMDYVTNDNQTVQDTYAALQAWFKQYSAFEQHTLYLSGVPTLTADVDCSPVQSIGSLTTTADCLSCEMLAAGESYAGLKRPFSSLIMS